MFETLRCQLKGGHLFVDSRSHPGMQTCVRCRMRKPFEGSAEARTAAEDDPGKHGG
ncbi:hypothetical protein [Brevundimonas viscosa]|uniref:Uncharacterized protein n=1 Tax=Brevundimonas viscosa TaxID=871741 RepID=A0A1I6S9B8_9CAUL|nr:hypothetical protein [Brevundimonas viscosa]SFS73561.1 hypothetical protein SAMN05192570_2300 [Brevundimonas viscosa]